MHFIKLRYKLFYFTTITKQVIQLIQIILVGSNVRARVLFVWKESGHPKETNVSDLVTTWSLCYMHWIQYVNILVQHSASQCYTTTKHRNKHSSVDMVTPLRVHFNRTMATPLLYIAIADTPWIIKTKPHDILFKRTEKGNTQYRREQMISC